MNKIEAIYNKRGYLKDDFEFFHIKDKKNIDFEFHYHDFNKIIIFISGEVTYLIEGKSYKLKPWDILFVGSGEIHRPIIETSKAYERIVIWVNSKFIEKHNTTECNLLTCFELASGQKFNLLRLNPELLINVKYTLQQLEDSCRTIEFGSKLMKNSVFIQLIILLNRLIIGQGTSSNVSDIVFDEHINSIINYINENIGSDLSIDNIANNFFMNKFYLMHRFKKQTGYTIHNYILQKRLSNANILIKRGIPAAQVCSECGFGDYSAFVRAFKKVYGTSPKKHYLAAVEQEQL